MPQWRRDAVRVDHRRDDWRPVAGRRRGRAPRPGTHEELRRPHRAGGRRPRPARRPGPRSRRGERRRQVDADEDPRRRAPGRRGHRRAAGTHGVLQPPRPGPAGRDLDGLPGVQPAPRADHRRERLPRPRAAQVRPGRPRPDEARDPGLLDDLGVTGLRATQRVRSLSVAEQQVVEIAKAVSFDARIISMDEPTAALADHEVALLYSIIRGSRLAASRSSMSPTGSRRSSTSARSSRCSRTAARSPPGRRPSSTTPSSCG